MIGWVGGVSWLKRLRDRELVMPICPGLVLSGSIEAQGLNHYPGQPPLGETLRRLLPEARLHSSATTRHLMRILQHKVAKVEEAQLCVEEMAKDHVVSSGEASTKSGPMGGYRSSMHQLHQYGVMAMEISRRLLVSGCKTKQTAAGEPPVPLLPAVG